MLSEALGASLGGALAEMRSAMHLVELLEAALNDAIGAALDETLGRATRSCAKPCLAQGLPLHLAEALEAAFNDAIGDVLGDAFERASRG